MQKKVSGEPKFQKKNPDKRDVFLKQGPFEHIYATNVLWWRSGFDLSLVIRDPKFESRGRNALQGRRRDLSSQEASLILK